MISAAWATLDNDAAVNATSDNAYPYFIGVDFLLIVYGQSLRGSTAIDGVARVHPNRRVHYPAAAAPHRRGGCPSLP